MSSRVLAAFAALVLGAGSLAAQAGNRHDDLHGHAHGRDRGRDDRARVVRVEPIYDQVRYSVPVEHCWDERVRHDRRIGSTGAAIAGGAAGAIIGNRISDGRGAGTVVGAIAGAAIGSELAGNSSRRGDRDRYERRCEVRHESRVRREVVAYWVTYEHRGHRDTARLRHDPGRFVDVSDVRRRG